MSLSLCLPVSPAHNGCLHPGYSSPQFLWEEQPVSQNHFHISLFISWSKQWITMPKLAAARQSWDTSRLAIPEGAAIPQPSCCSYSKLRGCPHVPQGQRGRHGHSCTPCLFWKVQTPTKMGGGHWASGCLAARQTTLLLLSLFLPLSVITQSVSWNDTEINEMGYHFYHCYIFGFTSTVNVKRDFKRFYSEWRVITMSKLRSANVMAIWD